MREKKCEERDEGEGQRWVEKPLGVVRKWQKWVGKKW
jgi:hypothetical protein